MNKIEKKLRKIKGLYNLLNEQLKQNAIADVKKECGFRSANYPEFAFDYSMRFSSIELKVFKNKERLFEKESSLRNNIFHYKIVGLDESMFDNTDNILATIIEAKSNYTIDNFISKIDCEIDIITQLISELIGY